MAKTVAIIDLGSNTFHLLISKINGNRFEEVVRKRIFVGLAEGGIEIIKDAPLLRAKSAFQKYAKILKEHAIDDMKIMGTAALRSASNADLVNHMAFSILGQAIEIINGDREAELIYKGVSLIADTSVGDHMIMDIGGGSTEFILIKDGRQHWSQSFNIGVAVLHEMFHKTEPIHPKDIARLEDYLTTTLSPLIEQIEYTDINSLIGASGSFEVVVSMNDGSLSSAEVYSYHPSSFEILEHRVIESDFNTRASLKGMPESRVKLIVVAFLLMKFIINLSKPKQILVSPYALKEGLIAEMM